jgi:hypothetical protein
MRRRKGEKLIPSSFVLFEKSLIRVMLPRNTVD